MFVQLYEVETGPLIGIGSDENLHPSYGLNSILPYFLVLLFLFFKD
jgi:hypothetical protein